MTTFLIATLALLAQQPAVEFVADPTAISASLSTVLVLASNRYRAGYSPYLEQLDAQRALLSAELSLVQARSDALSARVSLFQALGGGWWNKGQTNSTQTAQQK